MTYTTLSVHIPEGLVSNPLAADWNLARYVANFYFTVKDHKGKVRNDYRFDLSSDSPTIDSMTDPTVAPNNGEVIFGYLVARRQTDLNDDPGFELTKKVDKVFTGTIRIYGNDGKLAGTSTFRGSALGENGFYQVSIIETSRTPADRPTWTPPSN